MFSEKIMFIFYVIFIEEVQDRNISILYSLLNPLLKYNIESIILKTEEHFTDEDWISSLKGLKNSCLNNYNITNEDFVIGFEINKIDLEYLNKNNIRWINFEIHPVRF